MRKSQTGVRCRRTTIARPRRPRNLYSASVALLRGVLLLLWGAVAFAQQGAIDARTFDRLMQAQELTAEGQHEQAIEILDGLKDNRRLNSYARSQLWNFYAFIYANQGEYRQAIGAYEQVLAQEEATEGLKLTAKYTIAQMYFQLEEYDACIRFMEEWLAAADKATPTAHIMLAQAYYQKSEFDLALKNVDQAIALERAAGKPLQENWLRLKAVLYYQKQDYAATAQTYEELVRRYPKLSYLRQLAGMYSELGRDGERLALYDAVYEHGALKSENELLNLAYMWLGQEVPYKAGRVIETAMEAGKIENSQKNIETLANAWAQANEHAKAIPTLSRAAQLSDKGLLYARLAGVYFNAGDYARAAQAAAQADAKGGLKNPAGNLMLMGMAHFNGQEFEKALQAFRRAKRDRSLFSDAAKWEAYTLAEVERQRELARAKQELEKRTRQAIEADENNLEAISIGQ